MGPAWEVHQSHWLEFPRLPDFLSGEGRGQCRCPLGRCVFRPGPLGPPLFPRAPAASGEPLQFWGPQLQTPENPEPQTDSSWARCSTPAHGAW